MFNGELAYQTGKIDKASLNDARHILHLDCCHGPESIIAHGAKAFFDELRKLRSDLDVEHLCLWDDDTRVKIEYGLEHVRAKMAMLAGTANNDDFKRFIRIEELAARAATACGLVVSVPTWNYGAPWVLKQYFDCILHPGLTFREETTGPKGLLGDGRPVVVITSSGGAALKDHLTSWLLDVSAMIGFDDPTVIAAPNLSHCDRQLALNQIATGAVAAASRFSKTAKADGCSAVPTSGATGDEEDEDVTEWSHDDLLKWLRLKGGLTEDTFTSLAAARIDGMLFAQVSEDDWREEELGLEDADISRLLELQEIFRQMK